MRGSGGHRTDLRVCASNDIVIWMLDQVTQLPVGVGRARTARYAAVGRALADPETALRARVARLGRAVGRRPERRVGCQIPNMSQHLAVLRSAGLVTTRRDGSTIFYRLADPRVLEAYRLIQDIAR